METVYKETKYEQDWERDEEETKLPEAAAYITHELDGVDGVSFLTLFYLFPKEALELNAKELVDMPRHVLDVMESPYWSAQVNGDLFLSIVCELTARYVWPVLRKQHYEAFSKDAPEKQLAQMAGYWASLIRKHLPQYSAEQMKLLPREWKQPWNTAEYARDFFVLFAMKGVEVWNWQTVLDCAEEYRCHEDFVSTKTGIGRDFRRKWTHERAAEHIPLESCTTAYVPEDDWCFKLDYERFLASLAPTDRKILRLRMSNYTLQQIAARLGFKTHSAVVKRIEHIGEQYKAFAE